MVKSAGKKVLRSRTQIVFGGVFGGLADYIGIEATLLRLVPFILTVIAYIFLGPEGLLAFLILAIIFYALFGIFDQSKLFLDWPLLIFRLSYIGIFLMAYVTTVNHEAFHEQYLIEEKPLL